MFYEEIYKKIDFSNSPYPISVLIEDTKLQIKETRKEFSEKEEDLLMQIQRLKKQKKHTTNEQHLSDIQLQINRAENAYAMLENEFDEDIRQLNAYIDRLRTWHRENK